jgi:hypothetical protein
MRTSTFELVHVGSGQFLDANCIIAVASPTSFSIKRAIKGAAARGESIDMTHGSKTRSVIFLDDGRIFLTSRAPDIIAGRLQARQLTEPDTNDITDESRQTGPDAVKQA